MPGGVIRNGFCSEQRPAVPFHHPLGDWKSKHGGRDGCTIRKNETANGEAENGSSSKCSPRATRQFGEEKWGSPKFHRGYFWNYAEFFLHLTTWWLFLPDSQQTSGGWSDPYFLGCPNTIRLGRYAQGMGQISGEAGEMPTGFYFPVSPWDGQ